MFLRLYLFYIYISFIYYFNIQQIKNNVFQQVSKKLIRSQCFIGIRIFSLKIQYSFENKKVKAKPLSAGVIDFIAEDRKRYNK